MTLCLIDHILCIDIISMIYMLKLKQFAEAIIFLCVDTDTFMLKIVATMNCLLC